MSLPRTIGAVCGALASLLGPVVLMGWAVHSTFLVNVVPGLPPTQPNTALNLALSGLALLGIVMSMPRFTFIGSAIAAAFAAPSLLGYLFGTNLWIEHVTGRTSAAAALCFIALAAACVLAQITPLSKRAPILGLAGVLVAAVAAACGISLIWGGGNAFGLGGLTRMAIPTAAGFLLLGTGAVAVALDMAQAGLREPVWAAIGAGVFLATTRIGLLQSF